MRKVVSLVRAQPREKECSVGLSPKDCDLRRCETRGKCGILLFKVLPTTKEIFSFNKASRAVVASSQPCYNEKHLALL
jgi:hypothetical protein